MFTNPEKNVLEFGFLPGQRIADFGTGAGHYALALSTSVGNLGKVYAIDIREEMLLRLTTEAKKEGKENIRIILGDIEKLEGTHLKDESVDGIVFSNILFQLGLKTDAAREAYRILKLEGRVCIVEWSDLSFISRIRREMPTEIATESETKELFLKAGFKFEKNFDAGEHHYGIIFKK